MKAKNVPVVSYKELIKVKNALDKNLSGISISLDLGISDSTIQLFPDMRSFSLDKTENFSFPQEFNPREKVCYALFDSKIFPLKLFSEMTQFYYKLVPTSWRPILRISATQMHKLPFLEYLETLQFKGLIFDGGTGLGYSAITASNTAARVITVEWDQHVLEMATFNPHSKPLFENKNIELRVGDITAEIRQFEDNFFSSLIQDGGMPKSSGNFFSFQHCKELYRVLESGGELYFYLPQHGKSKGRDFGKEHINRLLKAGFFLKKRFTQESFAILYKR